MTWRSIKAKAAALWAREPVLLASALPLLTVLGILTSRDASKLEKAITDAAALVANLVAALGARAVVDSPATRAKK